VTDAEPPRAASPTSLATHPICYLLPATYSPLPALTPPGFGGTMPCGKMLRFAVRPRLARAGIGSV
jgi:hypothetical protein